MTTGSEQFGSGTTPMKTDTLRMLAVKELIATNAGGGGGGGGNIAPGAGSPEGVTTASPGATYLDTTGNQVWYKKTGTGNTGWIEIIAALMALCSILTASGQAIQKNYFTTNTAPVGGPAIAAGTNATAVTNVGGTLVTISGQTDAAAVNALAIARNAGIGTNTSLFWTNGFLYQTNIQTTVNTNAVYLTLGTLTAARGLYTNIPGSNPQVYTNSGSGYSIQAVDSAVGDGFIWSLVNPSAVVVQGNPFRLANVPPFQGTSAGWQTATNESSISLLSAYGTNFLAVPVILAANYHAPVTNVIYVEPGSPTANDYGAIVGNPLFPFRTLTRAAAAAATMQPTNIIIRVGACNNTSEGAFTLPTQCSLVGAGRNVTVLGAITVNGTNNVISGLTCGAIEVDACSNLVLSAVNCFGGQDGLFIQGYYQMTCYDSIFASPWDAWADYQTTSLGLNMAIMTNSLATFYGCTFLKDSALPGTVGPEVMVFGNGHFVMHGGSVIVRANESGAVHSLWYNTTGKGTNGLAEFYGTEFSYTNKGAGFASCNLLQNDVGGTTKFYNCLFATNDVIDTFNKTFFSLNHLVGDFTGNASGLTNLPALALTGTLSPDVLPSPLEARALVDGGTEIRFNGDNWVLDSTRIFASGFNAYNDGLFTTTIFLTNAPTFTLSNAAPANVTIGVTAPDCWFTWTNSGDIRLFSPGWKAH